MAHALTLRTTTLQPGPLVAATALAMLAGGVLVVSANVVSHAIPADCWPVVANRLWEATGCRYFGDTFQVAAGPARGLRDVLSVVAPLAAIAVGVRLGEDADRWSRTQDRGGWRGLWAALRPTALAGSGVILLLAVLGAILGAALDTGRDWVPGRSIASGGVAMLGRAAFVAGVAMLGMLLTRRPWIAAVLAVAMTAGWAFGMLPILHGRIERDTARWIPVVHGDLNAGGGDYANFDGGAFDLSRPGVAGEPGERISEQRFRATLVAACGTNPSTDGSNNLEWWCTDRLYADLVWELAAPADTAAAFAVGELGVGLAAGAVLLGASGLVLRRRARMPA